MEASINNNRKSLCIIRVPIQNPLKHLRWSFYISYLEHFKLGVSQGYEYSPNKTKQNLGVAICFTKNQDCNLCKYIFKFNFTLTILPCRLSQIQYTCPPFHMTRISHSLPVQAHHYNYRLTFSNFFGASKEHSIVLTLW